MLLVKGYQVRILLFLILVEEGDFVYNMFNGKIEYLSEGYFESVKRELVDFLELDVVFIISVYCIFWIFKYGIKYIFGECIFLVRFENEMFVFGILRIIWVLNFQFIVF